MLNINQAIIDSRIYYSTLLTTLSKTNNNTIQVIQNQAIRIWMGYLKTTPVNVILAESWKLPFEIQNEFISAKFIIKQIYYGQVINDLIQSNDILPKFRNIIHKYNLKYGIPKQKICIESSQTNLKVSFSNTHNLTTKEKLQYVYNTYTKFKTMDDSIIIFTDGSKTNTNNGIGIFIDQTSEIISLKIKQNLTIKSLEILAILIAVNLTSKYKQKKHSFVYWLEIITSIYFKNT